MKTDYLTLPTAPVKYRPLPPAPAPVSESAPVPETPAQVLFPSKINLENVQFAIKEAVWKFPKKSLIVLLDQDLVVPGVPCLDCRKLSVKEFETRDFQNSVFLYACDSDETGAPFIEQIISRGGTFIPVYDATPSLYVHDNNIARKVLEAEYVEQRAAGFAKWDFGPHDFINLIQAIDVTARLEGDYLEIGCFRGSSGCAALRYMREIGLRRNCYFLDVFEGFEYSQAKSSADAYWAGTHQTEGKAEVEKRLRKYERPESGPRVVVAKSNVIDDALPSTIKGICVANIDVDLYEAVLAAMQKVAPLIVKGGIMIVEDPGHTPLLIGARVALNHFLKTPAAAGFLPLYMQSGQVFLIRM
ncbi:MAG: hypothetical protein JWQ04_22 [Pedosphaera sp.]|nr:hypothetical protein [Pedosphaera sp.]